MYRALYGATDERAFWERQRNSYMVGNDRRGFAGGFEGQQSILAQLRQRHASTTAKASGFSAR